MLLKQGHMQNHSTDILTSRTNLANICHTEMAFRTLFPAPRTSTSCKCTFCNDVEMHWHFPWQVDIKATCIRAPLAQHSFLRNAAIWRKMIFYLLNLIWSLLVKSLNGRLYEKLFKVLWSLTTAIPVMLWVVNVKSCWLCLAPGCNALTRYSYRAA